MTILRKSLRDKTPEASVYGLEESLAKIATSMMEADENALFSVSDITPEEVFGLSFLLRFANKSGSKEIEKWVVDFLRLRISRLRLGRKEMMMIGIGSRESSEKKRSNITDLFSGLK
jgi:hypothetical protein